MPPSYSPIRLLAALVLFLSAWEVCARVDDAWTEGAPFFGPYDLSVLMTTDEFGIAGRPNARFSKWRMNELGFRGEDVRWDRERIVCVGASETFGMYEPYGMEFPRQLERELNRRAGSERYQVINAGLPGQSLSSFNRRAAAVIRRVRPTAVVLYPSLAIYIDPPPENFVPPAPPRTPMFRLRIAGKLSSALGDHAPESVQTAARRVAIRAQVRHRAVMDRIPESNVLRFRRDLSRFLDLLAADQVRAVLVTHATRFGASITPADKPMLIAWRALYPTLEEGGFLDMENRLNDAVRSEAAHRGLTLVDAARQLHGAENFVEFVHFTPRGAGALAHAIADGLVAGSAAGSRGARTLAGSAGTLAGAPCLSARKRRVETRRSTQQCVRHESRFAGGTIAPV
jgi:hypothetical protein